MLRASSYDHAVDLVNAHPYGNGAALFTRDGDAARDFAHNKSATTRFFAEHRLAMTKGMLPAIAGGLTVLDWKIEES